MQNSATIGVKWDKINKGGAIEDRVWLNLPIDALPKIKRAIGILHSVSEVHQNAHVPIE